MDLKRDLYVRTFLLCGAVVPKEAANDFMGVITEITLPREVPSLAMDLHCVIAIERGFDTQPHGLQLSWLDPDERISDSTGIFAMPTPEGITSLLVTSPLRVRWGLWKPGRYRLLLNIDGALAAFCPLDIFAVDASALGLPPIRVN